MIYFSTSAFRNLTGYEAAKNLAKMGFAGAEISGGTYCNRQLAKLKKLSKEIRLCIHSYFPPPKNPFVVNLASLNKKISNQSLRQSKKSILWSSVLGAKHFSIHAGFLIDPEPRCLGNAIKDVPLAEKKNAMDVFLKNINDLSVFAQELGVALLLENNVLTQKNYKTFDADPFLMSWIEDCCFVMRNTPANVSLLVDVGHVKVTARTLGEDPRDFLRHCSDWAGGYHLSENNSIEDRNEPFNSNSWFWPTLKRNLSYYSVEVNSRSMDLLRNQRDLAMEKLK